MYIKNYKINDDLTVDVDGKVDIDHHNLPVQFWIVSRFFNYANNKLTSLVGSPKEVGGDFYCYNNLTSLKYSPKEISFEFKCSNNNLTSLEGSPKKIKGDFNCKDNNLTSLEGLTIYNLKKVINSSRYWYIELNPKIKEEYFNKNLEENPDIVSLINFENTKEFKEKWNHLFNANKFDLI